MRSNILSRFPLLILVLATSIVGGCKHPSWKQKASHQGTGTPYGETSIRPLNDSDIPEGERPHLSGDWQSGQFPAVYFDYDSAMISPEELPKLKSIADHLKDHYGNLVIEGHCDERGTTEYNRALGERRALAAREQLVHLGVAANRISTISYGEDRPADFGHDGAAWSKNRRCEFMIVNY